MAVPAGAAAAVKVLCLSLCGSKDKVKISSHCLSVCELFKRVCLLPTCVRVCVLPIFLYVCVFVCYPKLLKVALQAHPAQLAKNFASSHTHRQYTYTEATHTLMDRQTHRQRHVQVSPGASRWAQLTVL